MREKQANACQWRNRADQFQALALWKKGREQKEAMMVSRDCIKIAERLERRDLNIRR